MWQIATVVDADGVIAYYCIYRPPAVAIVTAGHQVSQVQTLNERLGAPVIVWAHRVEVVGETVPGSLGMPGAPNVIQVQMETPKGSLAEDFFRPLGFEPEE